MSEPQRAPRHVQPTLIRKADEPPAPTAPLPTPLTSFVPREQEQREISALLLRDDVRLVSLTGPGGAGKTRLAIRIAGDLREAFDAIWFVPLSSISDPDLFLPALAQAIGLRESGSEDLQARLIAAIGELPALLVLDNFEQLVQAAPRLTTLLQACAGLKALVTTRTVLRVSGEFDFRVPPFELPATRAPLAPPELERFAAIRLFVDRAKAVDAAFTLNDANAYEVVEICRAVDGLPLAIELAAAQLRLFDPSSLRRQLERRLAVLIEGPQDQPERLQAMRNAIAWSSDLLSPEQQMLLRCISVFVDGFTEEALTAVWTAVVGPDPSLLQRLGGLIDSSLVIKAAALNGEQRYTMLETIREYARECLVRCGEAEQTESAHAIHHLTLAAMAEPRLVVVGSATWVERLATERANLRAAIDWALEHDRPELVLQLAGTLLSMAYARGEPGEGLAWLESALAKARDVPAQVIADALFTASALAQVQGDFAKSTMLANQSRAVSQEAGYRFGEARALLGLGITAEWSGDIDSASALYRESMELMREVGGTGRLAHWSVLPLANLADIALIRRDLSAAIAWGQEAVDRWREAGYLWGIAQALGTVAAACCDQGRLAASRQAYAETLDLWVACADGRGIAGTIAGIAATALAVGRAEQAARLLGAAQAVRQALGVQYGAHHLYAQRVDATVRANLDERAFERQWAGGHRLSVEDAVVEAREMLESLPTDRQYRAGDAGLSARELEVLRQIAAGHSDREIATALSISPRTVQSHVTAILTKMDARSRAEAAATAARLGMV